MAWDRYAYGLDNPAKYSDPTGHYEFEETPFDEYLLSAYSGVMPARRSTFAHAYTSKERRQLIFNRGVSLIGGGDALESFTTLVDYAAGLYDPSETDSFVLDLSCVILGYCTGTGGGVWKIGLGNRYADIALRDKAPFLGYRGQPPFEGQGSWSDQYYDGTSNQMFHFWFYVSVSYFVSDMAAFAGNAFHDPYPYTGPQLDLPIIGPWPDAGGVSVEDYRLGVKGIQLGRLLNSRLSRLFPGEVASWIWQNLGR